MQISHFCLAASLAAIMSAGPAFAAEDVGAGQEIYQAQCSACHSNQPGVNGIGPSLAGVAGRKAGSLQGFHYTPAISRLGPDLGRQNFHPVPRRSDQARAGHGDDRHGARRRRAAPICSPISPRSRTPPPRPSRAGRPWRRSPVRPKPSSTAPLPPPKPGFTLRTIMPARASSLSSRSRRQRQEPASRLPLSLRAIGLGADQPARLWRGDVSHFRARHRRHRCQDLPRALDLYLAA